MLEERLEAEKSKRLSLPGRIGVVLLFVLVLEVLVLINTAGAWPTSTRGWLLLLALGPFIYLLLEYLGGKIFSDRLGYAVSKSRFSIARIGLALLITLCIIGCALITSYALGLSFDVG